MTPRQRVFIAEYLVTKNATKAAINAGYSAKTAASAGWRLLRNVEISRAVEKGIKQQMERAEISASLILNEIKSIAFADFRLGNTGKLHALETLFRYYNLL